MADLSPIEIASLAQLPNWVFWKSANRDGVSTKLPFNPCDGRLAKTDDPSTWAERDKAEAAAKPGGDGVGLVLSRISDDLHLGGVDLDSCRDPATGVIEGWAQEIIDRLASYTEISPSGTGC